MSPEELNQLTDKELLAEAKKRKSNKVTNSFLFGFLIGIIIYSIVKNSWGILTLIPLYFLYQLINNSKANKALDQELKTRSLSIKKE